jgi:hypothetical protein
MESINFSGVHALHRGCRVARGKRYRSYPSARAQLWDPHVGRRTGLTERSGAHSRNWFFAEYDLRAPAMVSINSLLRDPCRREKV